MLKIDSKKTSISIIGCGRISLHYIDIFTKPEFVDNFLVESCVDTNLEKARLVSVQLGCLYFSDLSTMLKDTDSDLYIVLTPSGTHFEIAKELLMNGRNVLTEKPGTLTIQQSIELKKHADLNSLFLGCVHQNRFNHAIQAAKKQLESKALGKITNFSVRLRWSRRQDYYNDGWHGTWGMDGGVVSQQAFHHLDIIRFLLGEVDSIFSFGEQTRHNLEAEDTCVASIKLKNGSLGTFEATTTMLDFDREASIEIFGEDGHICIGGIALNEIISFSSRQSSPNDIEQINSISEAVESGYGNGHFSLLMSVRGSITEGKKEYDVSWEESTKTLQLIHSIYASQELNRIVYTHEEARSSRLGRNL
jgi:predicted dehydrogenase